MSDWLSIEDLYAAYLDCRKRKRNTRSASLFEQNEASNLAILHEELNNRTYRTGKSDAFCVTRPKLREVFAADFRDRIVHHLLILRLDNLFEKEFIDNTFNCRKGKGTDYGVRVLYDIAQRHPDGWCLCFDIKGFFMHIDKQILCDKLHRFIDGRYNGSDKDEILWLTDMVVKHRPELLCERKGDTNLWKGLEKDKSLFTNGEDKGLAIGNLTSQIFANFYLSDFDHWISNVSGVEYVRYVDDGRVICDSKKVLLKLIPAIRKYLHDEVQLQLHKKKISVQPVRNGIPFIGSVVKVGRCYIGNRTIGNAYNVVERYSRLSDSNKERQVERFVQRMDSYLGFMRHRNSYTKRRMLCMKALDAAHKYIYVTGKMLAVRVKKEFKTSTKLHKRYGKIILHRRRISAGRSKTRIMGNASFSNKAG